jgi:hypothetical protein
MVHQKQQYFRQYWDHQRFPWTLASLCHSVRQIYLGQPSTVTRNQERKSDMLTYDTQINTWQSLTCVPLGLLGSSLLYVTKYLSPGEKSISFSCHRPVSVPTTLNIVHIFLLTVNKPVPLDEEISLDAETYHRRPTPVLPGYVLLPSVFQEGTTEHNCPSSTGKWRNDCRYKICMCKYKFYQQKRNAILPWAYS